MPNIEFDLDKLAQLSMLSLSQVEREGMERDLPSIVAYVSKLHEVDTSQVASREYLTDVENVYREDVVAEDDAEKKAVIDDFPAQSGGALQVPAIFE